MRLGGQLDLYEHFRQNALAYCGAAERLDTDPSDAFIAPISLCLGFAIEFFLKCVLLKSGKPAVNLGKKPYGHDLWSMGNMDEFQGHRQQAGLHAQSCFQDIVCDGIASYSVPEPRTFDAHLEDLSLLHSSASGMALRYPTKRTPVPPCSLMICVFDRLIRGEKHGDKIVSAP